MLEEARHRRPRQQDWGSSSSRDTSESFNSTPSMPSQQSDTTARATLSDEELLQRARAAYADEDFASLAAGPAANGPWVRRVRSVDRFVVFRRDFAEGNNGIQNELDVLCAGRMDTSIQEVASILRSSSEMEHNASMAALYAKSFIFGSYEREVYCSQQGNQSESSGERLIIKTKTFARTTMLGRNEQWCYYDYFLRKTERDGFTISKRALPPMESVPGRIVGENAHVDQLHGLNASYLVDRPPSQKGLRVVFHAWFDLPEEGPLCSSQSAADSSMDRHNSTSSSKSSPGSLMSSKSLEYRDASKHKAQMRRLLAIANGVTNLPELIRRRRFGVQIPASSSSPQGSNSRCPCCTHSLAPVKLTLVKAASAIKSRSLTPLKMDTKRCYLCGYLVCFDCWSVEHMESVSGRVASIVVCTRCNANVQACEYSEVVSGTAAKRAKHRGPPRVVEDSNNNSTVSLLVDFLSASALNSTAGSPEHAAVVAVIRALLRQENSDTFDQDEDENYAEYEDTAPCFKELEDTLQAEEQIPTLAACSLGNAEQRSYPIDLPEDPTVDVPRYPIPSNEADRIAAAKTSGLLQLADRLAPATPGPELWQPTPDTHDLNLLYQLAAKTLDCEYSFVAIMCAKHEHFLAENHPLLAGTVVPREITTCQHALMSPYPFMAIHHEADVHFHKLSTIAQLNIRFYLGFQLKVPIEGGEGVTVGMFCCIDSKPRAEITRTQYVTMKRLASTATYFLQRKGRQVLEQQHLPVD
ncbi:hypothetical protein PHYSODRAFT_483996 [Phytophthora sojae]|uniref:GAF domain-containing protein n=1 Tax=Phytophthora sojae (strain P6497) TaxID=1094619 RepID=G4YTC1_PHYSP|nr:hypothetical protein PHYSODRAFT_483996 [Phytophthora sojae]EGZ23043.1 hypothetical protein PHYSODRAFT_483996 [Phytophthora sojae]|eukprot:XP_009518331.1 hypothetical protein PHYSODRAFT_483996 [Phytophthora sojae]